MMLFSELKIFYPPLLPVEFKWEISHSFVVMGVANDTFYSFNLYWESYLTPLFDYTFCVYGDCILNFHIIFLCVCFLFAAGEKIEISVIDSFGKWKWKGTSEREKSYFCKSKMFYSDCSFKFNKLFMIECFTTMTTGNVERNRIGLYLCLKTCD